jgi:tetratricopeptide (TPR) repeat protein
MGLTEETLELTNRVDDPWLLAEALNDIGGAMADTGDGNRGTALLEESLALRRALGDELNVAGSLINLGVAAYSHGAYPTARRYLEESLQITRRLGDDFHTTHALDNLGLVALFEGRYADSAQLLTENVRLCADRADRRIAAESLQTLAGAFAALGEATTAIQLAAAAHKLHAAMGTEGWPMVNEHVAPLLTQVESNLDTATAAALKKDGQALTLTQAAQLAAEVFGRGHRDENSSAIRLARERSE